jgi:hypothetical protein
VAAPTMNGTKRGTGPRSSPQTPTVPTRRNRTRIVLGAALMVVAAFAAAVLYADAGERDAFLVVAKRVPAGQVIAADDLSETLAAIDGAMAVPASQRASMVGRVAAVELVPGSLLSSAHVSDARPDGADEAVVAARLDEGRAPADLAVGDSVLLYEVPAEGDDEVTAAPVAGRVVAIETAADGSSVVVSVAVAPADARRAAVAAARGRLTLVLAPR